MSDASSASDTVKAIGFALIAAAAFFWILATVGHIGLSASDAAGNGLAQGLALVELFALYFALAVLALVVALGGAAPPAGRAILIGLCVIDAVIAFRAGDLLERSHLPPAIGRWRSSSALRCRSSA